MKNPKVLRARDALEARYFELVAQGVLENGGGTVQGAPRSQPVKRSAHGAPLDELARLREDPKADVELAAVSQKAYEENRAAVSRRADLELQAEKEERGGLMADHTTVSTENFDREASDREERIAQLEREIVRLVEQRDSLRAAGEPEEE